MPTGQLLPVWRRGFPFYLAQPRSAVERLRSDGSRQVWNEGPRWRRLILASAMTIGWPIVTLVDSTRLGAKRAREGRARFLGSFGRLYWTALTRNIPPRQSELYESELGATQDEVADFLLPLDLRALQRLSLRQGAVLGDVQDKARFAEICHEHGLPCVRTLASFDHGTPRGEETLRSWKQAVFVKALTGNKGAGAELWRRNGEKFVSTSGQEVSAEGLIDVLLPQNCIVQPALEDHPALKALGTVALSSIRIITAKGRTIPAAPITAALSLAVNPESLTGRFGVQCGVDLESGLITKTTVPIDEEERLIDRNVVGFAIPGWNDCVSLVCKAHDEAFPAFATLGWDIALTSDGPILLETNVGWGMTGHQRLDGPLGKTVLAAVIDELLEPADAGRSWEDRRSMRGSRSPSPAPPEDRGP